MNLKKLLFRVLHGSTQPKIRPAQAEHARAQGVNVSSLAPTQRVSQAEAQERIRAGRVAELTEAQAGLSPGESIVNSSPKP